MNMAIVSVVLINCFKKLKCTLAKFFGINNTLDVMINRDYATAILPSENLDATN